jgi:hypothetical protein
MVQFPLATLTAFYATFRGSGPMHESGSFDLDLTCVQLASVGQCMHWQEFLITAEEAVATDASDA